MSYDKLVAALRGLASGRWRNCEYTWFADEQVVFSDAADAIEALQADMKTYGKTAFDEGYAMGFAAGEDRAEKQMPKRGEIVRCGECKWYGIYEAKKDGTPDKRYSPSVCLRGIYAKRRDPDWFCADGEREAQE